MTNIDIMITGSSRPQLIPYCVDAIKRFITSQSKTINYKWYLHEDSIFPELSKQTVEYAKSTGIFEKIILTEPAEGLGLSIDRMIREHITAPFMLYVQEDFEFNRTGIDMDRIIWTMNNHKSINYIIFNKRNNRKVSKTFIPEECDFDGMKLTLWNACNMIPSLWRMDKCREKWRVRVNIPEGYWINSWGNQDQRNDVAWLKNNMGCYLYGGYNEYAYAEHIGNTWRMEEWRMIDGKPGGNLGFEVLKDQYKIPWLKSEKRPINKDLKFDKKDLENEGFKKAWDNLSDNAKKELDHGFK